MSDTIHTIENINIPLDDKGLLLMPKVISTTKALMSQENYGQALNYLNHIKNHAPLKSHTNIILLHNLYIDLLLEIEDYPSLLNILISKRKYLDKAKDINMHYFYMAICYEGLDELQKAIQALESIEDILSRKNLANKYLKLAILYAQKNHISKAKAALDHAAVFDRDKENNMFLLAKSDILYQEGRFHKAIQVYEDFFIKSKRKYAYLNRFIRISLALNRLDDAIDFFLRHKEQVLNLKSIQPKLGFFKEALPLLKDIDQSLFIEANNILEELNKRPIIHFDEFEYFQVILNQTHQHKIYQESREVLRDFLIALDQSKAFLKMAIVKIVDAKPRMYHYSKTLLLEKDLLINHPLVDQMIDGKTEKIYSRDWIDSFEFVSEDTEAIFVEKIDEQSYFLGYVNQDNYDLARKLSLLSVGLLREKLNNFSLIKKLNSLNKAFVGLMDNQKIGMIKIHNNLLIILNESAKKMMSIDKATMAFTDFQKLFTETLYLDDFIHNQSLEITLGLKKLLIYTQRLNMDLYLTLEEVIEEKTDEWQPSKDESLILLDIFNHIDIKNAMGYAAYGLIFKGLVDSLPKATNQHLLAYQVSMDHQILLRLDNRDKRIFERLDSKLKVDTSLHLDIRYAYHYFNHKLKDVKAQLYQLISMTNIDKPMISGDLPIRKKEESDNLYLKTIQRFINDKHIVLKHAYVKNWNTQKVTHIDIDYDDLSLLTDSKQLKHVLKVNQLEILFDRLIVNQLINDQKCYQEKTSFIIPISKASIESKKAFNYLLRRLQMLESHHIYYKISIKDYMALSLKDQTYLNEKGIHLAIIGPLNHIGQIDGLIPQSICFIGPDIFKSEMAVEWIGMLRKRFKNLVYDHQDNQLLKTDLERLNIHLVKGGFSGYKEINN